MDRAQVLLWHFPISHFNEKVRWALDLKRVAHVRRALGLSYLPRALWATGRPTLPVLFLDGRAIGDSTRIIAALEQRWPDPPLYPRDEAARRRALALEDDLDETLGPAIRAAIVGTLFQQEPAAAVDVLSTGMGAGTRRVMRAMLPIFRPFYTYRHKFDPANLEIERSQVRAALDRIAAELRPSGYLVGDSFSVADLTAAALLSPIVLPPELEYPPPAPRPRPVEEYRRSLADHPAFRWAAGIYARHRRPGAAAVARGR